MKKGQATREYIITKSAPLFNQKGYNGSSMADVMAVTGLKKGGIYNHFASKDEIALAAFDHNWQRLQDLYDHALQKAGESPSAQLLAAIEVHANISDDPAMAGGCPLLNTAIENDDGHPQLRERAQDAIRYWHELLREIVDNGIAAGEFRAEASAAEVATVIISTLEGSIMLSKLFQTHEHIRTAVEHLNSYVRSEVLR